jgi:hypothetical protein
MNPLIDEQMRTQITLNLNEMIQPLQLLGDLFSTLSFFEVDRLNGKTLWHTYHEVKRFVQELDRYMELLYQSWDQHSGQKWTNNNAFVKWAESFLENYYITNPHLLKFVKAMSVVLLQIQDCWITYPGLRMIFGYDGSTIFNENDPLDLYQMARNEDLLDLPAVLKKLAILQQDFYSDFNWRLHRSRIQVQELSDRAIRGEITPELVAETEQVLFNLKYALKIALDA